MQPVHEDFSYKILCLHTGYRRNERTVDQIRKSRFFQHEPFFFVRQNKSAFSAVDGKHYAFQVLFFQNAGQKLLMPSVHAIKFSKCNGCLLLDIQSVNSLHVFHNHIPIL